VELDLVFKALADGTRRRLLDSLRTQSGQHLGRLEDANLVATVRRGREKLHYLNPVPIHEIHERWIQEYERQYLSTLHDLKKSLEGDHHG
jgi:DNA-binding transcriptional ArsR family regulator